jgi:tetratricopeptide (TPR) repeat protein
VAAAIVGLFIAWGRIDVPHYHYSSSLANLVDKRTLAAVQEGQKAVDEDPDLAIYQLQLGLTQTLAFTQGESSVLLDHGIAHLQRGVELDPRSAIGYANLARALTLAGKSEEARTAALAAQRLAGADATVLLAAGSVLEDVGASQDAIQTYALAVTRMGSLADSDFWGTTTFRREHYAEIIGSSVLSLNACSTGYLVSQISGDSPKPTTLGLPALEDGCRALVFASPDDLYARVDLAEILMASGEHDAAYEQLTFATNREPDFGPARTSMGKWYAAAGDVTRAREEWILGGQLGEAESLLLLGDTYPPDQVPADVVKRLQDLAPIAGGAVTDYPIGWVYYQMKFAREAPPTYLLPDDWQTALPRLYNRIQQALQRWQASG